MTDPRRTDVRGMAVVAAAALAVYGASVSPVVFWGDSAELATRAASLELSPVARAYPLHRVLSWAAGRITGSPALGANLVSAVAGAVAAALAHEAGRRLSGSRLGGFAAAGALALCPTFWLFAGVAEVYTLHAALLLALFLAARSSGDGPWPRRALGALAGLSLLHHRMIAFAVPGIALLAFLRMRRAGGARRDALDVAAGFAAGALPFVLLCLLASRAPPEGTADPVAWWFRDVFLGGDQNAAHLFGSGVRSFGENVAYVGRWLVYDLPGPALLLVGAGLWSLFRARRDESWAYAVLLPSHVVFPLRYDWTGDQFSFLLPFVVVAIPLVAVGIELVERRNRAAAAAAAAATVVAPVVVALTLAFTAAGERILPGITEDARRALVLPVHTGRTAPRDFAEANLVRLPDAALLHADWGDGQVYRYLQAVEGLRPDVEVRIWYGGRPRLQRSGREEWLSEMPGRVGRSPAVRSVEAALEDRGGGLHRVLPAGAGR